MTETTHRPDERLAGAGSSGEPYLVVDDLTALDTVLDFLAVSRPVR